MTADPQLWGPWRPDIDPAERLARFRSLRSLAGVLVHPTRAAALIDALREAEANDAAAGRALEELDRLPALPRRRILASYAKIHSPPIRRPKD